MSETIRVFDLASLSKLRDEYRCTSNSKLTANVPVIINSKLVNMATGSSGTSHFDIFKSYADTTFTEMYSYMFLIYLTTGDYTVDFGTGNVAFLSFSSSPLKSLTTYSIPSGTYVCQIFVNAGSKLYTTLKKKDTTGGVSRNIYEYALKCESIENEDLIYDEFYGQLIESCARGEASTAMCKRVLGMDIMSDPRLYLTTKYGLRTPGSIVNGEWVVTENTCPIKCGTGSKKSSRDILKYLGRGASEKTIESKTEDCSIPCPVNGYFSNWTDWSLCSKDCGGGTQTRYRSYTPAVNGGTDLADRYVTSENRTCNTQACPIPIVPSTKIMDTNLHTYTALDVRSPSGKYRFSWQPKTYYVRVYYLSGGIWSEVSSAFIMNTANNAALGTYNNNFSMYNSSITIPSVIGTCPSSFQRLAITDNGDVIFEDLFGKPVGVALAYGKRINF